MLTVLLGNICFVTYQGLHYLATQMILIRSGVDPGFSEGGSESEVDLEGWG